jgi:hypothetical protein
VQLLAEDQTKPLAASLDRLVRSVEGWSCRTCLKDDIFIQRVEIVLA